MKKTRFTLMLKGFLTLLACGSNGVAQEWRRIERAADEPGVTVAAPAETPAPAMTGAAPVTPVNPVTTVAAPAFVDPTAGPVSLPAAPVTPVPMPQPANTPTPADDQWLPEFLKRLPHPPDEPDSLRKPAPAQTFACTTPGARFFEADPLLIPPNTPQIGWFSSIELEAVAPHIYHSLSDSVTAGSRPPDTVDLPNRGLDWTVAPRVEVGFNLPSGFGGFALSYRFMGVNGSASVFGPDGPAPLQSRMDLNVVDLDYVSWVYTPNDRWTMTWRFGGRLAYLYYDSVLNQTLGTAAAGTGILEQHATNSYYGFGPHASVELTRQLGLPGLSMLGRLDAGSIIGRIRQGVSESALDAASPTGVSFGQTEISSSQTAPMASILIGLNWKPDIWENVDLFAGYQYEYWWNVGRLSLLQTSRGELQLQGITARLQISY